MLRAIPILFIPILLMNQSWAQICDYSLGFSGVGSHVDCGIGSYYTEKSSLTVEAWVNIANPSTIQTIVGNMDSVARSGFRMGIQNGQLNCQVYDSAGTMQGFTAGRVYANTWTHLAFTYTNGGRSRGYVNGIMVINFLAAAYPIGNTGSTDLIIGAAPWNQNQQAYTGQIDEVRIYNYQRSTAQIREDMRLRLQGGAPGLIGYWRFDEGYGVSVFDHSLSGRNGTLMGSALPSWILAEGPYGSGSSSLSTISNAIDFSDEGLRLEPNSPGINDTFVVSRIDCHPNVLPTNVSNQTYRYWIVDHYDTTAGLTYDFTFKLDNGSLDSADASNPGNLVLFRRDRFSAGAWVPYAFAVYASATTDSVRFENIRGGGQFIIATNGTSLLGIGDTASYFRVYPQPADNRLIVDGMDFLMSDEFMLFDLFGRPVPITSVTNLGERCIIDISDVPDGSYLLQMEGEKRSFTYPVMVLHQ